VPRPDCGSWTCRECRAPIFKGEELVTRDGRKLRLMYHSQCFSGDADPRTQIGSSIHEQVSPRPDGRATRSRHVARGSPIRSLRQRLPTSSFSSTAPASKGRGKWSTSQYGYNANPADQAAASRAASAANSRAASAAPSAKGSVRGSRAASPPPDPARDKGTALAGRVVAMAAMRLEKVALDQAGEAAGGSTQAQRGAGRGRGWGAVRAAGSGGLVAVDEEPRAGE
jgi:hypothetical protein